MRLNPVTVELREALCEIAGPGGWVEAGGETPYLEEPRGRARGRAALILKPDSTDAVSRIVAICAKARVGVIPFGGGTGLVGGQVAEEPPDPVVLSVERLRQVRCVLAEEAAITVEAGCTLAEVRTAAAQYGWMFPLRIASEGDCRIGGNLATNAGGMNVLRFGNARDLCLGIEAVMADGRVWEDLRALRKDNTGYDLRNLLIGSEGTLGIITAATLRLFPKFPESATVLAAVGNATASIGLAAKLRRELGDVLSAIEVIEHTGVAFVRKHFTEIHSPFPEDHPWYVLVETEGGTGSGARERLEKFLMASIEDGTVADAVLAESEGQRDSMHKLREAVPLANRLEGAVGTHDVSVPLGRIAELVENVRTRVSEIEPRLRINIFGHLGDGNLHANVFPPVGASRGDFVHLRGKIAAQVFGAVRELGGSISAEHGVGRFLKTAVAASGSEVKFDLMRSIKQALDPRGILNPGAVLDMAERGKE